MSLTMLLIINLVLTSVLTGLIWTVQLVHYPGFLHVGTEASLRYQRHHTSSITFLVVPLMLAELIFSVWLLKEYNNLENAPVLNYSSFACVVIIWVATFGFAVPLHNKFSTTGYARKPILRLIKINWIRTISWSLRLIFVLAMLLHNLHLV